MQITRTNITQVMSFTSLVRTAEGFARMPGDYFEVFNMLEYQFITKFNSESANIAEICRCLYTFASLSIGSKEFYNKLTAKIHM